MSGCDIGITPEYCRRTTQVARKGHDCGECESPISIGEEYVVWTGVWDGEWESFKQCQTCAEEFDRLVDEGESPTFGDLWGYLGL